MSASSAPVAVNVITGFLGSGKTTLLRDLLASPSLSDTAVLINEFGEIGLDHLLVEAVSEDLVLLKSGCICCTIRGDLKQAIGQLYSRRERGEIARFRRLAIETTGLADPVPVVATIMTDPVLRHHFRLGHVVTVVDAVNAPRHAREHAEWARQVAIADRLVIAKADLVEPAALAALEAELRRRNPMAMLLRRPLDAIAAHKLLTRDLYDPRARAAEVRRWLDQAGREPDDGHAGAHGHDVNRHGPDIRAVAVTLDEGLDWPAFGLWLTMLLNRHGDRILRVKGLLHIAGVPNPVVIHGVQHLIHPPVHLAKWPGGVARTQLVLIGRDLDRQAIETSLTAFNRVARAEEKAPA